MAPSWIWGRSFYRLWTCSSRTLEDDNLAARCLSYELSIYQIRILRETSSSQTIVPQSTWTSRPLFKRYDGENGLSYELCALKICVLLCVWKIHEFCFQIIYFHKCSFSTNNWIRHFTKLVKVLHLTNYWSNLGIKVMVANRSCPSLNKLKSTPTFPLINQIWNCF